MSEEILALPSAKKAGVRMCYRCWKGHSGDVKCRSGKVSMAPSIQVLSPAAIRARNNLPPPKRLTSEEAAALPGGAAWAVAPPGA